MSIKLLAVVAALMIFSSSAASWAADPAASAPAPAPAPAAAPALASTTPAAPTTVAYAPADCDFRMDFPSTPAEGKRCDPTDASRCSPVTTYTHVFGMNATVNFTVTCNQAEPNMYERYSGDVMRATLDSMVGKGRLDHYQTGYKQFEDAKQATIIGTGKEGASDKIYIAQLWIGHKSVFTVEGELIGQDNTAADDMFANILRTIRYKDWKPGVAGPAPAKTDAPKAAPPVSAVAPATAPAVSAKIPSMKLDAAILPEVQPNTTTGGMQSTSPDFAPPSTTLIVTPTPAQTVPSTAPEHKAGAVITSP